MNSLTLKREHKFTQIPTHNAGLATVQVQIIEWNRIE